MSDQLIAPNLYADVRQPVAERTWIWRGRVNGSSIRRAIRHPNGTVANASNMKLSEARRVALDMTADARNGGTRFFPQVAKVDGLTVGEAWKLYMRKEGNKLRPNTRMAKERQYERFIEPVWGDRPVKSITTADCRKVRGDALKEAEDAGQVGTAVNVLHINLNTFFEFCVNRDDIGLEANPMSSLKKPVNETLTRSAPRSLSEREIRWLFRALDGMEALRFAEAIELVLRSACRRNEIFEAQWGWLSDDGLLVPADKAKNGCPILVPLTDAMKALVGERPKDAKDEDFIFGSCSREISKGFEGMRKDMTKIARKDGFNGDFSDSDTPFHFTLHSFRDSFFTLLGEPLNEYEQNLFPVETRDAVLNHRPSGVGSKHYDATARDPRWFYPQRKGALRYWNELLDKLKAKALEPERLAA